MRRFRLAVLLCTLIAFAAAPLRAEGPPRQRVTIAIVPSLSGSPFPLAVDRGYFNRFSIEPVLIRSAGDPAILTTLNAGGIDLVMGFIRPLAFELVNRGGRIRAVASGVETPTTCTGSALVVSAQFAAAHPRTAIGDLRGARIGMSGPREGTLGDFIMAAWLQRGGLTIDDVELIRTPLPAMADILARGTLDAVQVVEPQLTLILLRRDGVVLGRAQEVAARMPTNLLLIGPTLRSRPGLAARVLAAYLLGVRDYMAADAKRNPRTIQTLVAAFGQSEEAIRKSCWSPIPRSGQVNVKLLGVLRDWMFENGYISKPAPMDQFVDEQYLREAWRLLTAMGDPIR